MPANEIIQLLKHTYSLRLAAGKIRDDFKVYRVNPIWIDLVAQHGRSLAEHALAMHCVAYYSETIDSIASQRTSPVVVHGKTFKCWVHYAADCIQETVLTVEGSNALDTDEAADPEEFTLQWGSIAFMPDLALQIDLEAVEAKVVEELTREQSRSWLTGSI